MARNVGFWTLQANTNGTLAGYTGQGGGIIAAHAGADNDLAQASLYIGKAFKLAALTRGWFQATLQMTNADSKLDAYLGFTSGAATGTGVFSDTAATLATTQDALMFYRLSDSAFFRAAQINGSAVDTDAASAVAQATATDYYLRCDFEGRKGGLYAEFRVGSDAVASTLIRTVTAKTFTSFDEMYFSFGCKSTNTTSVSNMILKNLTYDIDMSGK
jgi:hypothetical protein